MFGQRALDLDHGGHGLGGPGKGGEESVTLGVNFSAIPGVQGFADDLVVAGQQGGVLISQLIEQLGGTFDVSEEESDGPTGKDGCGWSRVYIQKVLSI
jgi:hypothetical protein